MQEEKRENASGGLLGAFSDANKKILKYVGLGGALFWVFTLKSFANTAQASADATLLDGFTDLYSHAWDAATNDVLPGAEFILSEAFNLAATAATDFIMPGVGTLLHSLNLGL